MTDREYTPHQRRMIRNFYQNRDALRVQHLQEWITELYLAGSGKKADRLWERVLDALRALDCPAARVDYVERTRDLTELQAVVQDLF